MSTKRRQGGAGAWRRTFLPRVMRLRAWRRVQHEESGWKRFEDVRNAASLLMVAIRVVCAEKWAQIASTSVSKASPANSRLAIERSAASRWPKPHATLTTVVCSRAQRHATLSVQYRFPGQCRRPQMRQCRNRAVAMSSGVPASADLGMGEIRKAESLKHRYIGELRYHPTS
jgi:hypothetical protein